MMTILSRHSYKLTEYRDKIPVFIITVLLSVMLGYAFSYEISPVMVTIFILPFAVLMLLVHPVYILGIIVALNPLSDLIVVRFPSFLTKEYIDILIMIFIMNVAFRKILSKGSWKKAPFYKWIFISLCIFIISALVYWTRLVDVIFMNWIHFRFIYLAMAVAQLDMRDEKYAWLIKIIIMIYFLQIAIGLLQIIGGEWVKSFFFREGQEAVLSYGILQYENYDTASLNPGGSTYIYSTFFLPIHYGAFLLIMLCLVTGLRAAGNTGGAKNAVFTKYRNRLIAAISQKKAFWGLLILTFFLILMTFNRTTQLGIIILIMILIMKYGTLRKMIFVGVAFFAIIFTIANTENIIHFLENVYDPELGVFDPVNRFLAASTYFLTESPRKIAYFIILPYILLEKPLLGFGVTSALNQANFLGDSISLSDSLYYVYGDAGIVRLFVEYGLLGAIGFCVLYVSAFKHALMGYRLSPNFIDRTICFATMAGIILLLPMSFASMVVLSKSFGLYLWMFIGLSQRRTNPSEQQIMV